MQSELEVARRPSRAKPKTAKLCDTPDHQGSHGKMAEHYAVPSLRGAAQK